MKRLFSDSSRIVLILVVLFIIELVVLFFQFRDASTVNLQFMMGITGLTLILIGYFVSRFRGRDWKGNRDYQ
ncbi:MAG TPA: hypothetical protein PLL23_10435 [Chitinophagaceae bacterium]|nr:hypothetical protein [Chitinophagaceae bacterium]